MKKIVWILMITLLFAANCEKKLFSLHIYNPVSLKSVLQNIINTCDYSLVLKDDESKMFINQNINYINLKNATLNDLLNLVFSGTNLFYSLKNNQLYVSFYKTKIFKVNFIPNSITGSSNIDSGNNNVKTDYTFNFWANLKTNLIQILENVNKNYKVPVIDKDAGLVSVTGTKKQLLAVQNYLDQLNKRLHREVLIDVKIYSVALSSSHKTGIDWSQLSLSMPTMSTALRAKKIFGSESIFNSAQFSAGAFLNFLAQNGNVNSVSNPKIVTLNNQKAIIQVGDTVYYKQVSRIITNDQGAVTGTEYTVQKQFIGVLLDITPQISDNGTVILSINPKISSLKDPTQLNNVNRTMPPDTQDNSMITVVRLKNNQTLVLGGLIANDNTFKVNGVPVLKEIPLVKYLFSSKEKVTNRKELVFVITPHIIDLNKEMKLKDYGYGKILPNLEDLNVK